MRLAALSALLASAAAPPIDRHALVIRNSPTLDRLDPRAPLMLGNGELGFTADITGLQTFPEAYAPTAPLLTMAQWAWHSFPNPHGYRERDGLVRVPVPGRGAQPYPYMRSFAEEKTNPALAWLRENPHRISLGRVGLLLTARDGTAARFDQIADEHQRLDLWSGTLRSDFRFENMPVSVETRVAQGRDAVLVTLRSPLVRDGRLGVVVRYPGVAARLNPDPSDWAHDDAHRTVLLAAVPGRVALARQIDDTHYWSTIVAPGAAVTHAGAHRFEVRARGHDALTVAVSFDRQRLAPWRSLAGQSAAVATWWRHYWTQGGAIDFTGSTDPRARELERRVVLSQYLAAVNEAGEVPPQEEGLFSNSWNGKFHLEMHAWHSGAFASWGRQALLARSMDWYRDHLGDAQAVARAHQVEGAWWPKMAGPEGRNSPSTINPFIMWQQPHPIYLAELLWRAAPTTATLARYGEVVEQTGRLLASWPRLDEGGTRYMLGPPIIPVQENHPPLTTFNPTFELEYFRWGLRTAQAWRVRRGLKPDPHWANVIARLAAPAVSREGFYLPVQSEPNFWTTTLSPACSGHAEAAPCLNYDHPSFLMAYGLIAGARIDRAIMRRTLAATAAHWDFRQTWGWDYPMIAMTAARLGDREAAIDWLFRPEANNQWTVAGMTPRVSFTPAARGGPDGPGLDRVAETYFPANGSLLLAVGMMAAGWEGSHGAAPGFPRERWRVQVEGIRPLP